MAANDEQKAIFSVLQVLLEDGKKSTRTEPRPAEHTPAVARQQFTALNVYDLKRFCYERRGRFPDRKVIYLESPPRAKSAVTAMWCRWDFNAVPSRCGYYFGVWSKQETFPNQGDGRKYPAFLGFRYETPECGDNHDYYHAQPCRSMGDGVSIQYALPTSERYPTFPLAAQSSLELLLCLVASIYGMRGLRELQDAVSVLPSMRGNHILLASLKKFN